MKKVAFTIRLPVELNNKLIKLAKKENLTKSQVIYKACRLIISKQFKQTL